MGQAIPSLFKHYGSFQSVWVMALLGCLLGLSAPGYPFWWTAWVAFIPALFWAYQYPDSDFKKKWLGGFLFGFCFQALYCLWFFDLHPLTWLGFDELSSRLVTLAGWLLIGIEGGLLTSVFFAVYQPKTPRLVRIFGLPILWISLFLLLNLTPMALPWGMLEFTQAPISSMRWLAGATGTGLAITGLLVLHNVLWAEGLLWLKARNRMAKEASKSWLLLMSIGSLLFPALLGGLNLWPKEPHQTADSHYPLPIAIVQANLPIEVIRSGRLSQRDIEPAYLAPIRKGQFPAGTLVLFPEEGVVPGLVSIHQPTSNGFFNTLMRLAQQKNIYIAVGVSTLGEQNALYNSIALISSTPHPAVTFYNKRRLVPFGEYTPYELGSRLTSLLNAFQVDYSAPYSAGLSDAPLLAGSHSLGGLLCFELIDPLYAQRYRQKKVSLLINLSNLGWFHQNSLIENQFLAIGQIRAAESGIPLAIASNTGISAILSASGEVLERTQPQTQPPNPPQRQPSQLIFHQK
ncbi:apolipoprotein N-acyltransferase [Vampirovibrio sp.]|uniref:apolipoprotein N-acyltransferase n=1 Tax=Vampirovibrio sp. TaxID=2717857 RepID=UPI00359333BB